MITHFPAEWAKQDAIILAWPNKNTDWKSNLKPAQDVVLKIIEAVTPYQQVLLLVPKNFDKSFVADINKNLAIIPCDYNDTWTRDYMPISVIQKNETQLLDFGFNAWGGKHPFSKDNQATATLEQAKIFKKKVINLNTLILEGGSIESNGNGLLLTTEKCLLNKNRNPHLSQDDITLKLQQLLGVKEVIWLKNGEIKGDDTDAHIDTIARFIDEQTIVYAKGNTTALKLMETELKGIAKQHNLKIVPVIQPQQITTQQNEILPATYVNFLITNEQILVPTYNAPEDENALQTIQKLSPNREVVGIDCNALIQQHGSLHCITMQLLKNTINPNL